MLANWVRQRILAASVGDIFLGDSVNDSFTSCSKVFLNDGELFYSVEDGLNRENGVGTYIQASNKIIRTQVFETLINGIYSDNVSSPMSISNESIVSVTATVRSLTTHVPVWKDMLGDLVQNLSTSYLTPDVKPIAGNVEAYMFGDSISESLGVKFAIPHDVKVGADMFPHIRWSPTTDGTGVVRWGIEYLIAERETGVFQDSTTIYLEESGSGTLGKLQLIESTLKIVAGKPDTVITGRVFRDSEHANDTYVGDAALHVACLHYLSDAVGTPRRDPNFYVWG